MSLSKICSEGLEMERSMRNAYLIIHCLNAKYDSGVYSKQNVYPTQSIRFAVL
jgi:hypothetical protein